MTEIIQIPAFSDNYIYLIVDQDSRHSFCVDPGLSEPVLEELKKRNLKLDYILVTHHHNDHIGGTIKIKEQTKCKIVGFRNDASRIPEIDIMVDEGHKLNLGRIIFEVFEVPGHTIGHVCYYSKDSKLLFCGDTLFSIGCGRVFEGTNEQMLESLLKIRSLPDDTRVFCGHEYTESNILFALTLDPNNSNLLKKLEIVNEKRKNGQSTIPFLLGDEKKLNPFLNVDNTGYLEKIKIKGKTDLEIFNILRKKKDNF